MLREVEPLCFLFFGHTNAYEKVRDLQENQRADHGDAPSDQHSDELVSKLCRVSLNQANRHNIALAVMKDGVDGRRSKYSG